MLRLYVVLSLMLLCIFSTFAANYYVSPSGKDSNTGTLSSPFATIMKAQQAASSGDIVYLRGGTYRITNNQIASTSGPYAYLNTINKNGISYFAYSGETPIIDVSNLKPSGLRVVVFYVTADNCHFRGLEIIGTQVTVLSHTVSYVFRVNNADNNIFERLSVHDGMATAVYLVGSSKNNLIVNCDSYNNWDSVSENKSGENTDGFGCHVSRGGTGNVFRGCRAWFNSDDGYDCIGAEEKVIIDNCWAFYNGYSTSFSSLANGNGFKVGGYGIRNPVDPPSTIPRHLIQFCLAVRNKDNGFYANHHLGGNDWYNNSAYMNGTNYNMLSANFNASSNTATDTDGYNHKMRNNLGFQARGTEVRNLSQTASDVTYNYFSLSVSVTTADFKSLDQSRLTAPRKPDGSLPDIDLMKLVSGSDLIDKGQDISQPYKNARPDLGCFEYGLVDATPDCNGTLGGTARLDECGRCVEGTTKLKACVTDLKEGYYKISAVHSGLCLQNKNPITQEVCTNTANQYWHVTKNGNAYQVSSVTSKAYMGGGNNTLEGNTSMSVSPIDLLLSNAGNGNFLISPTSTQNLFFDVFALLQDAGERLILWENTGATNQHFTFTSVDIPVDCNGDLNGTAKLDNCGVCVGGSSTYKSCTGSLEAETACTFDGTIDINHLGFSGDGFVNTPNELGSHAAWKFTSSSAQTATFSFRYANGSSTSRGGVIMINGTEVGELLLPTTGSWSTWATASVNLPLSLGANELVFEANTDGGLANLDLVSYSAGVSQASCLITSVETDQSTEIKLYPNPTTSTVNWSSEKAWELTDAQGQVLSSGVGKQADLNALSTGVYFMNLEGTMLKVVKQ